MNEHLIKSPSEFIVFLEEAELSGEWDADVALLIGSYRSMSSACCSGPRKKAARVFLALYRKIVDNRLGELKGRLLQGARRCGYDSLTFEINENSFESKGEKRGLQPYQKTIIQREGNEALA